MSRQLSKVSVWLISAASFGMVFAQEGAKAPASPMGGMGSLLPMMLIMFAVVYFLMIRPEQKRQKERNSMLQAIKKGDRVMTSSGILGTVGNIKESTIMVKIAENTVVEFTKGAVTSVINNDGSEKKADAAPATEGEK